MSELKKEVVQEGVILKQPIKARCVECNADLILNKICPSCNHAYTNENKFCTFCGTKLKTI